MKVSVIMPLYNKEKYVKYAIESILNQSYEKFELIIVDDKSIDNSLNIVKSYKDERVKIYELEENKGVSFATNKAIEIAKGEIIVRMDADDIALNNRIEKIVEYFENNDCDIIGSKFEVISDGEIPAGFSRLIQFSDRIFTNKEIEENFTVMQIISQPTMAYKKSVFKKNNVYNTTYKTAEDYEQLCNFILDGFKILKINESLLKYRFSTNSLSNSKSKEGILNSLEIKTKYIIKKYKKLNLEKKNIYIWGKREHAKYLKNILIEKFNLEVITFVDFEKNISYEDSEVMSHMRFREIYNINNDIVLTMWNLERDEIIEELESFNLIRNKNYFIFS